MPIANHERVGKDLELLNASLRPVVERTARMKPARGVIGPETIGELVDWRPSQLWWRIDGQVGSEDFLTQASKQAEASGRSFNPIRWFHEDDDLIVFNGGTYAFSNQWGGRWSEAMDRLAGAYPELQIRYDPTAGAGDEAEESNGWRPADRRRRGYS